MMINDVLDLTIYADCLQGAGILGSGPSQLYKLHLGLSQVSNNHLLVKRREEFAFLIDYSHFPDRPIGSNSEESISRPIQVYSTRVNKTRSNSTKHPQFVLPLYILKCTVLICWQIQVQVNVGSISLPLPHRWDKIWELLSWLKSHGGHNNMRRFSLSQRLFADTYIWAFCKKNLTTAEKKLAIFTFVFSPWVLCLFSLGWSHPELWRLERNSLTILPQCQWAFDMPT